MNLLNIYIYNVGVCVCIPACFSNAQLWNTSYQSKSQLLMLLKICRPNSEVAQPSKKVWSLILWSSFKYKIMQMHWNWSTEFLRGHFQQKNMVSKPIIIEVTRMETANGKQRKICINLKLKCVCICDQWMNESTHLSAKNETCLL